MTTLLTPAFLLILLAGFGVGLAATADAVSTDRTPLANKMQGTPPKLVIGVRSKAMPFSYRSKHNKSNSAENSASCKIGNKQVPDTSFRLPGPLGTQGYDGYMIRICDEVLVQLCLRQLSSSDTGFDVTVVDLDHGSTGKKDRFDRLLPAIPGQDGGKDKSEDRGEGKDRGIDILCDPATISTERARQFVLSPPVFMTGIGYLQRPLSSRADDLDEKDSGVQQIKADVGVVGSTNAVHYGIKAILEAGEWQNLKIRIFNDLSNEKFQYSCGGQETEGQRACGQGDGGQGDGGQDDKKTNDNKSRRKSSIFLARNHRELARAFCTGKVTYYVGDMEIIKAHANEVPGCDYITNVRSFTIDRYAIFARADATGEKAKLIAGFFGILNRKILVPGSLLDHAYTATFGNAPKSAELRAFFRAMRGAQ